MKRFLLPLMLAIAAMLSLAAGPANATAITLLGQKHVNTTPGDTIESEQVKPWRFEVSHDFGEYNDSFIDTYKFKVSDLESLSFKITTWNHVLGMNFEIFDNLGNELYSLTGITNALGTKTSQIITFTDALLAQMVNSKYLILKITGAFCSCSGYSIAAFPLPPAAIMFLTAIAGLGFLAWRRKQGGSNFGAAAA